MDNALTLRFTRLSDAMHRFEYRRTDGSGETLDLESAGVLFQDLLHFAVETEAGLNGSFYGLVARVGGYAELSVGGGAACGGDGAMGRGGAGGGIWAGSPGAADVARSWVSVVDSCWI